MKQYGKKQLRNWVQEQLTQKTESRDGIVWDVDTTDRYCRVKIQGTNEYVIAHYPENWEQTPTWLKPGNAVRIQHKGGVRGRVEVTGHGRTVPSPTVASSGETFPSVPSGENALLSGGTVTETTPLSMAIEIGSGEVRILGVEYEFSGETKTLTSAPSSVTNFRYDQVVVGADGVADVVVGSQASIPSLPDIPANHVGLHYVLLYQGMDDIEQMDVDRAWEAPRASYLTMTITDDELEWNQLATNVRVTVYDQYDHTITTTGQGWSITLEIVGGNGQVSSVEGGAGAETTQHAGSGVSYSDFTYTRGGAGSDISPVLTASLNDISPELEVTGAITLKDEYDNSMYGGTAVGVRDGRIVLVPEYPGAVMYDYGGSTNTSGELGMTSDVDISGETRRNFYGWIRDVSDELQGYDIVTLIPIPMNFVGVRAGSGECFTVEICTEEVSLANNKVDLAIKRNGVSGESALNALTSTIAGTWRTVGFDESDPILANLDSGETLVFRSRMYSFNSKYSRIGTAILNTKEE